MISPPVTGSRKHTLSRVTVEIKFLAIFPETKCVLYSSSLLKTTIPILLISGIDDPCTGGEKGRQASLDVLRRAGFACIDTVTLDGMRHEILNESAKDQVFSRILSFFEA